MKLSPVLKQHSIRTKLNARYLANIIFLAIFSFTLCLFYCNFKNTIHLNGNWTSKKTTLEKGVMGAIAYLTSRVALSQNKLHLDSWHGHQEVYLKNSQYKDEVQYDFFLPHKKSYFLFIFGKKDNNRLALRLSRTDLFPSSFLIIDQEGKFLKKIPLKTMILPLERGTLKMVLNKKKRVTFLINDKVLFLPKSFTPLYQENLLGFRGGSQKAIIDNLSIDLATQNQFVDHFSNYKFLLRNFIITFGVIISIFFLFDLSSNKFTLIHLLITITMISITTLDFYYLAQRYPNKNSIESFQYNYNIESEGQIIRKLNESIKDLKNKNLTKVLFIGSSQTWGAGAQKSSHTFVNRINALLNTSEKNKYLTINAGISDWRSTHAIKQYKEKWIHFNPRIVVINLSNNDSNSAIFKKNLEDFVHFNNRYGIKTIFIFEANSTEYRQRRLLAHHKIMGDVAKKMNIKTINMHDYLAQKYDTGLLWWDEVHLTSYGQFLVADKIFHEIRYINLEN